MSELIDAQQQEPEEAGFTEVIRLIRRLQEKGEAFGGSALLFLSGRCSRPQKSHQRCEKYTRRLSPSFPATETKIIEATAFSDVKQVR